MLLRKIFQEPGKYRVTINPGYYRFECWGAQGGKGCQDGQYTTEGGPGSYVAGYIPIKATTTFYCFVGGMGGQGSPESMSIAVGGYNGGGKGGMDNRDNDGSGGGGGASDIRTIDGDCTDIESLKSRIIVAAGGSGSAFSANGAPGGDLTGYLKTNDSINDIIKSNTTNQDKGNGLGVGEDGHTFDFTPSSGAGGGYYGGVAVDGIDIPVYKAVSSSGSSYISGYEGCISNEKYVFYNAEILHGNKEFLNANGEKTIGNKGNGAIVITLLYNQPSCMAFHFEINLLKHLLIMII